MSIVDLLVKNLPDTEVIQTTALAKAGICGSSTTVRSFLKEGKIPSLKIGSRTLISKNDVIEYLNKCSVASVQE